MSPAALRLDPKEIDKERGIILSEKRARDSVGLRTAIAEWEFLVPDTRFPQRLPIGTEEVIRTADPGALPANSTTRGTAPSAWFSCWAGDIDPAAVEPLVREILGPLAARGRRATRAASRPRGRATRRRGQPPHRDGSGQHECRARDRRALRLRARQPRPAA
ncbi:MAG: hypothetical protein WDM96_15905 [Lacunisphaera sp.]